MAKFFVPLVATPPLDNGGGGGSDLPAVSAADNGDVLTVVNGVWDKAAPGGGGGGGVLFVNATDDPVNHTYTLNKTAKEVIDAYLAGQTVIVSYDIPSQTSSYGSVVGCEEAGGFFYIYAMFSDWVGRFIAPTENDYPSYYYE